MGLLYYLVNASWLISLALGYEIDASCTRMGHEDLVRNAMTSAFGMARSAYTRLDASPWTPDTRELVDFLFAKEGQHPSAADMDKTIGVFRSILYSYEDEILGDASEAWNDVIIYCNHDRLQLVEGKRNEYRDQSNGVLYKYNEQPCHGTVSDRLALAITMNPRVGSNEKPTQIQLCPWFVDWLGNKEFKLSRDVFRTNIGQKVIKKAEAAGKFRFRQIDVYSLLDKVLLHEMTHGRMAFLPTSGLDDVRDPASFILGIPAYGWPQARRLAQMGTKVGLRSVKAPDHNSDSLALFASVCVLLDDTTNPRKVAADGKIIPRT